MQDMKKAKLTPEEKAQERLDRKVWAAFIRRMAKLNALILEPKN